VTTKLKKHTLLEVTKNSNVHTGYQSKQTQAKKHLLQNLYKLVCNYLNTEARIQIFVAIHFLEQYIATSVISLFLALHVVSSTFFPFLGKFKKNTPPHSWNS